MEMAMGFLDDVGGALKGALGQGQAAAMPALISAALAETNFGDLQGLLSKLQLGGLKDQVQSCLGNGANLPITTEQVREALRSDQVTQFGDSLGMAVAGARRLVSVRCPPG